MVTIHFEFPRDMVSSLQEGLAFNRVIAVNSIIIDGVEYKNLDFEKQMEESLRKYPLRKEKINE